MLNLYLVSGSSSNHLLAVVYKLEGTKPEELISKLDPLFDDTGCLVHRALKQFKEPCVLNIRKDSPYLAQVKAAIAILNGEGHHVYICTSRTHDLGIMETYAEDACEDCLSWIWS